MDQEKSFVEEINEKDLKSQQIKKIFIILLILAMIGGAYYYYNSMMTNTSISPVEQTVVNVAKEKAQPKAITEKPSEVKKNDPDKLTQMINAQKQVKQISVESSNNNVIKPASKDSFVRYALAKAGKKDPFSSEKGFLPYKAATSSAPVGILPPPPSIGGLPTLGGLPNPGQPFKPVKPKEELVIKGFIGSKVIVSINGIDKSMQVNESFQGIKVSKIDPVNLIANFEKNGKVITKNIKSLTEVEDKNEIRLVKNFNKQD